MDCVGEQEEMPCMAIGKQESVAISEDATLITLSLSD